jgi:hypothetical protein
MEKEFEKFRNQNPYKVPDDFFRNITKQTLEKARQREKNAKVRKMLVIFTTAASVIILLAFGYLFVSQQTKKTDPFMVESVSEDLVPEKTQPEEIPSTDSVNPKINQGINKPIEKLTVLAQDDRLENLIAGLSDEDLRQLEAVIQEELLITELLND